MCFGWMEAKNDLCGTPSESEAQAEWLKLMAAIMVGPAGKERRQSKGEPLINFAKGVTVSRTTGSNALFIFKRASRVTYPVLPLKHTR